MVMAAAPQARAKVAKSIGCSSQPAPTARTHNLDTPSRHFRLERLSHIGDDEDMQFYVAAMKRVTIKGRTGFRVSNG